MQPRPEDTGGWRGADRTTHRPAPRPPAIASLPTPQAADAVRLVWWLQTGFRHGMTKGGAGARLLSGVLWIGWWPAVPLLIIVQAFLLLGSRRSRYYLSPDREAVLAIRATGQGWHLQDHQSRRPGTGAGRALRAQLIPTLLDAADRDGVTIYTTAATTRLAARYAAELPGLTDIGQGWPRGRLLHRPPRTPRGPDITAQPGARPSE
ncbi:hypothetical protein AB0K08_16130 [Citricoccus sp. NPDC055426]|uniref:hypothetical protein n=1 Tax=Citricoccus sp. NPDC055426 TaxID=3155536 RepID=UPI00342875F8